MNRSCSRRWTWLWLTTVFPLFLAQAESRTNRFEFRLPHPARYRVETTARPLNAAPAANEWLRAWPEDGSTNFVEFGSRVVVQLTAPDQLRQLIAGRPLELAREVNSTLFILQAPNAATALAEAERLARMPAVSASYPVLRRQGALRGPYAQRSNDPFFSPYFTTGLGQRIEAEWFLENRDWEGRRLGLDLNVMAAWPYATGEGVTVAVADTGVEMNHNELVARLAGAPHANFSRQWTNTYPFGGGQSDPAREFWTHGTSVAGLIAAEGNNGRGIVGVAPRATVASWVIFQTNLSLVSDEALMDMFQYASNTVAIQNHSWGPSSGSAVLGGPTPLERAGIANAVTFGRNGLGSILVRAAGNDRALAGNANDDGYANDPQQIAVGSVTQSGRVAEFSEPGACLLVAAPGGEGNGVNGKQGLITLDLVGSSRGVNSVNYGGDLADYRWGVEAFSGTSSSAPLISGLAALLLSANPNLGYRDVQQILLLSARPWDTTDPDLTVNGAGLPVSHNVGFGVPDAGQALYLGRIWTNRPPLTTLTLSDTNPLPITEGGLQVEATGDGVPTDLASIPGRPGFGPHADTPTASLPLVYVGLATNPIALNLTNKAALIQRGTNNFDQKINFAAQAGAAFAVIYNFPDDDSLVAMLGTDLTTIPSVFIGNRDGEALKALFETNTSALARIRLQSASRVFQVSDPLSCEHVGVRVQADYPVRGDLRITLLSPMGTRSVLQHCNRDLGPGPFDWTFWSVRHFFESSVGDWTVAITDEATGSTGTVQSVSLILRGTPITDTDRDGLDDAWESARCHSLAFGPRDDPDHDGYGNAREQVMGTDPLAADLPLQLDLTPWQLWGNQRMRLSWPGSPDYDYEVWSGTNAAALSLVTNLPGRFPETEYLPARGNDPQFYRVRARLR